MNTKKKDEMDSDQRYDTYSEGPNLDEEGQNGHNEADLFVLKQLITLFRLSIETSSKVVAPAINQMLQTFIPKLGFYYEQLAPTRIKEWLEIVASAFQNMFNILSQTQQGKELLSQFESVFSGIIHFLTSPNMRQVIIEGVGVEVKFIEALRTPQMKAFLGSLPVFYVRVLDLLSSGESKLLAHSITPLIWNTIDLLGQEETTLAFAEFAAQLVHALEREREKYGPWNRKRAKLRRQTRVKLAMHQRRNAAAINSKRRYERNKFISQTYTDRVILMKNGLDDDGSDSRMDGEVTVEDAILSSLGDGTRSENVWLTTLGRNENENNDYEIDEASLPSKVVLPKIKTDEEISVGSMHLDNLDAVMSIKYSNHGTGTGSDAGSNAEDEFENGVNVSYLRDGIKQRSERFKGAEKGANMNVTTQSNTNNPPARIVTGDDIIVREADESQFAIEDLVFDGSDTRDTKSEVRESKPVQPKELAHEDNIVEIPASDEVGPAEFKDTSKRDRNQAFRGTYSSVAHFYRALDDIQTKLRDKNVALSLGDKHSMGKGPGVSPSTSRHGEQKWRSKAAAAAGAGNEKGQNILRPTNSRGYSRHSSRLLFKPNIEAENQDEENEKATFQGVLINLLKAVPLRYKFVLGGIAASFVFFTLVWFLLGCYGLYFLVRENLGIGLNSMPSQPQHSNEIVLRIVQDPSVAKLLDNNQLVTAAAEAIQDAIQEGTCSK